MVSLKLGRTESKQRAIPAHGGRIAKSITFEISTYGCDLNPLQIIPPKQITFTPFLVVVIRANSKAVPVIR
jgi:hypothetical protein